MGQEVKKEDLGINPGGLTMSPVWCWPLLGPAAGVPVAIGIALYILGIEDLRSREKSDYVTNNSFKKQLLALCLFSTIFGHIFSPRLSPNLNFFSLNYVKQIPVILPSRLHISSTIFILKLSLKKDSVNY